jgi:hypothetical protein
LKKHINGDHYLIARKFEEKINNDAKKPCGIKNNLQRRGL